MTTLMCTTEPFYCFIALIKKIDSYFLCFSLVHPNSFHNIKSKWLPELKQFAPQSTFFLVGTKTVSEIIAKSLFYENCRFVGFIRRQKNVGRIKSSKREKNKEAQNQNVFFFFLSLDWRKTHFGETSQSFSQRNWS